MRTKLHKAIVKDLEEAHPFLGREGLIYTRVSSKKQETEGSGLESQEKRCMNDLQSIGVPHTKTFQDSFSGFGDFMRRPAMNAMFTFIDANPHKKFVIVFDDISRLARDTAQHLKLRTAFRARDVELRCLNYNFDESEEGEFMELIFAGKADLDRKQNRRQVIQKMKARVELGFYAFAKKRGYEMTNNPVHGNILIPTHEGKTILRKALTEFASGDLLRKVDVARFLHAAGFWKKSKRPPERYIDQVSAILSDVVYCGDIEYQKWGVSRRKGRHEGIISIETFELIQKRLRKAVTSSRLRIDINPDFPLRGLLICSECGEKLTAATSKGRSKQYLYYFCYNKQCSLRSKSFQKEDVERKFTTLLQHNRIRDELDEVIRLTFDRVWKEEVAGLKLREIKEERERETLRDKMRDLTDRVRGARSDVLRKAYEDQLEETAAQLQASPEGQNGDLRVPYRTALSKSIGMLKNPVSIWETVDTAEKHRLFFFLFDARLAYTPGEGFRTANTLSTTRIFEEFADANSDDVDPTGFEPVTPSLQMRCSTK